MLGQGLLESSTTGIKHGITGEKEHRIFTDPSAGTPRADIWGGISMQDPALTQFALARQSHSPQQPARCEEAGES